MTPALGNGGGGGGGGLMYEGHSKSSRPLYERQFKKMILLRLQTITSCKTIKTF